MPISKDANLAKDISKFGKHFLIEIAGTSINDDEKRLLDKLQPSAIMLRKRNFLQDVPYEIWLEEYKRLIDQFTEILGADLIISIDHEGGRVIRPPDPITKFPYAAHWEGVVAQVAKAMAVELKSLAINVNFAPVADIHSNPDNPVINERAFGTSVEQATNAALEFAGVLQKNGIAACAKHFPGHGDTKTDSHFGLPTLELSLDELRDRELVPFEALVDAGIQMIMTAHILFPKIDPDNPATLSKIILNDLLRKEMSFNGVIIADALGMAAMSKNTSEQESLVRAMNAGLDIFLVAGDNVNIDTAVKMAELLGDAVKKDLISDETISLSRARISNFIEYLPQYDVRQLSTDELTLHHALAEKLAKNDMDKFDLNLPGFD
jgi:beta-N-acetylhexosaminidase